MAISGDTLVVGAPGEDSNASDGEDDNSARNVGAAYVFTRSGGMWGQQAYLKESTTRIEHVNVVGYGFGTNVAISGDTLVVGYPSGNGQKGEAFVFTRSDGIWSQQAYLNDNDAAYQFGNGFGSSVAISDDTLVVGNPVDATAYIYTRVGEVWTQRTQLKASNAEQWDDFGFSVAISGDTLVVGAPEEDSSATGGEADNSAPGAGAVYTWQ
ncbi:MAG: hypothetical protein ABW176_08990 [Candidatus Thiodiazotropha endolucinida]